MVKQRHMTALLGLLFLAAACSRETSPERVALEYGRARYARDLLKAYRLISARDRQWKTEGAFVAAGEAPTGNALELARHLASFIELVSAEKKVTGDRAGVKLRLRLPDANAPEIVGLVREWDEAALNALSESEREGIRKELDQLHQAGKLPMLEGDESFELVREEVGWRVVVHWAESIRVRFRTRIPEGLPLRAVPPEQELLVKPGEPAQITVQLTNGSAKNLSMRVSHEIEPKAAAPSLVFLQCPLLLPVRLGAREAKEFSTTFMVAEGSPTQTRAFEVTFAFRPPE